MSNTEKTTKPFDGSLELMYYKSNLVPGSGLPNVAVCTQWTVSSTVASNLPENLYALRGPLYSPRGVEFIARHVLINPVIRDIVLCGADANGSGEALVALVNSGVGDSNEILNLTDEKGKPRAVLDAALPKEAIDLFREHVSVIDLRDEKDWRKIAQRISEIPERSPFSAQRVYYPETMPTNTILPAESMGISIQRDEIYKAWLEAIRMIRQHGIKKPTDKGRDIQELASLHVVVNDDPKTMLDNLPDWLPVSRKDIENYLPVMLDKKPKVGIDVAYTYGSQMQNYDGIDQIEFIEKLIASEWYTKRAVATTWHLPNHLTDQVASAPCLVDLMFLVQDDKLLMSAHFRSHDMYRAWLSNVYGLRALQFRMAQNIGIAIGHMEVISNSAHLWQDVAVDADKLIEKQYRKLTSQWKEDPRGNFVISVENGEVVVKHTDVNGNFTGKVWKGTSAKELQNSIISVDQLVSMPGHAAYLVTELLAAAQAARSGLPYTQDKA